MADFDKERSDLLQASIVAYHELMRYIREDVARAGSVGEEQERELNDRLRNYRDACDAVTIYDHEAKRAESLRLNPSDHQPGTAAA